MVRQKGSSGINKASELREDSVRTSAGPSDMSTKLRQQKCHQS